MQIRPSAACVVQRHTPKCHAMPGQKGRPGCYVQSRACVEYEAHQSRCANVIWLLLWTSPVVFLYRVGHVPRCLTSQQRKIEATWRAWGWCQVTGRSASDLLMHDPGWKAYSFDDGVEAGHAMSLVSQAYHTCKHCLRSIILQGTHLLRNNQRYHVFRNR